MRSFSESAMPRPLRKPGIAVAGASLLAAGLVTGAALFGAGEAAGQPRSAAPPEHFLSGSQLSLPVLKEIAATLKQMDARLARLEGIAQQMQTTQRRPPAGGVGQ